MGDDDHKFGWGWPARPSWFERLVSKGYRFMPKPKSPNENDTFVALHEKILGRAIETFGPDGGPTNNARFHLGVALERSGRLDEARLLFEEVLAANRRHRDPEGPHVLGAEERLAANLYRSGRFDEARSLFAHVRDARERTLGSDDPGTLRAGNWLAATRAIQERD